MKNQSLTYEQFAEQYKTVNTVIRQELRAKYPKFAAKHMLLSEPGPLKPGSTVFVLIRKRSRTSMHRAISLYSFAIRTDAGFQASKEKPALQALTLTYNVGTLLGYNVHECEGSHVIRTSEYPNEFVSHLSQILFGVDRPNELRCEVL